jgi:hypothetical protein
MMLRVAAADELSVPRAFQGELLADGLVHEPVGIAVDLVLVDDVGVGLLELDAVVVPEASAVPDDGVADDHVPCRVAEIDAVFGVPLHQVRRHHVRARVLHLDADRGRPARSRDSGPGAGRLYAIPRW